MGDTRLLVAFGEGADGAKEGDLRRNKCKHLFNLLLHLYDYFCRNIFSNFDLQPVEELIAGLMLPYNQDILAKVGVDDGAVWAQSG